MITAFSPRRDDRDWKILYRAAILETDKTVVRRRVAEAEQVVLGRGRELFYSGGTSEEQESLEDALYALRAFRTAWEHTGDVATGAAAAYPCAVDGATVLYPFRLEGRIPMFTRVVEITTKAGKSHDVANTIDEKILPFLRQQPGFLDETVLTSDTESNRVIGISFWKTKEDAERYARDQFPTVNQILENLIETTPVVRTFHVHTSTPHKIAAGKAA